MLKLRHHLLTPSSMQVAPQGVLASQVALFAQVQLVSQLPFAQQIPAPDGQEESAPHLKVVPLG